MTYLGFCRFGNLPTWGHMMWVCLWLWYIYIYILGPQQKKTPNFLTFLLKKCQNSPKSLATFGIFRKNDTPKNLKLHDSWPAAASPFRVVYFDHTDTGENEWHVWFLRVMGAKKDPCDNYCCISFIVISSRFPNFCTFHLVCGLVHPHQSPSLSLKSALAFSKKNKKHVSSKKRKMKIYSIIQKTICLLQHIHHIKKYSTTSTMSSVLFAECRHEE